MSGIAMSAVLRHSRYAEGEKTYVAFKVLMVIADHANREGVTGTMGRPQACLSTERIAQEGRISKKSVLTWLPKIEESGELTRTIYGEAGSRHTVYKINLPMDGEVMELSKLTEYSNSPNLANELMEKIDFLVNQITILVNQKQNLVNDLVNERTDLVNEKAILVNEKSILVNELGELGERLPVVRVPEPLTGKEPVTGGREEAPPLPDFPDLFFVSENTEKATAVTLDPDRTDAARVAALAEVCGLNLTIASHRRRCEAAAAELFQYSANTIRVRYSDPPPLAPVDLWFWFLHDWRGQKGERPNLAAVVATIAEKPPRASIYQNGRASPPLPAYSANQPDANGVF